MSTKTRNPIQYPISTFKSIYDSRYIVNKSNTQYETCIFCEKYNYSYEQAVQMIRFIRIHGRNRNKIYLRPYKCKKSGCWHLTSEKPMKQTGYHYITI